MAEVISFEDIVRSRRRRRQQELTQRCIHIVELNLRVAIEIYEAAPAAERPACARHVRKLAELLEYALTAV